MTGMTLIFISQVGIVGIIPVLILLIIIPVTHCLSKVNSAITGKLAQLRDKRIQISAEIIEGIKYVKLYGWEMAFKRRILEARDKEVELLKKLAFSRAFSRTFSKSICFFSSFVLFLITLRIGVGLSSSLIFSVLVVTSVVQYFTIYAVYGVDILYELNIMFKRYVNILNIENPLIN